MKLHGFLLGILLTAAGSVFGQVAVDSSFSVFINGGRSYTRANDPHINKWLSKYGYPPEAHVPRSFSFEVSAIPVNSRFMYSVKLSTITSPRNFTSFNILGGLYYTVVRYKRFLLLAGAGAGYHNDIITLNGELPPAYKQLEEQYKKQLSLRRDGLFLEPLVRAFWYPLIIHNFQLGLYGGLGADLAFNSNWKLGYYDNKGGMSNHFKKLQKPADQQKASEHGLAYNLGMSIRLTLH